MSAAPRRLVALTGEIRSQFGGLTMAMLERSASFAGLTDSPVEIVTLAYQPDLEEIRAGLRARGLLPEGVVVVNLWEQLADADDAFLRAAPFDPAADDAAPDLDPIDIVAADGRLVARQWWWTATDDREPITPLGDRVLHTELYDRSGVRLGGWRGQWALWQYWLTAHLGETPSDVVVDSAWVADFTACVDLGTPVVWLIHNAHTPAGRTRPFAPLERWRAFAFTRAERFARIVFLTESQRRDFAQVHGHAHLLDVIPNALTRDISPDERWWSSARAPAAGLTMARFEHRKRLDHAVRAVAEARAQTPDVRLRMYGKGPKLDEVTAQIELSQAPVELAGHTDDADAAYRDASYLLLTSRREGLPLVLAEAMAQGCLPIAYDIAYGPRDLIEDGVDGFVVPAGDVGAVSAAITSLVEMAPRRVRAMRQAARTKARSLRPEQIVPRWLQVFESVTTSHPGAGGGGPVDHEQLAELELLSAGFRIDPPVVDAVLTAGSLHEDGFSVDLALTQRGAPRSQEPPEVTATLRDRDDTTAPGRPLDVTINHHDPDERRTEVQISGSYPTAVADHVLWLEITTQGATSFATVTAVEDPRPLLAPAHAARRAFVLERRQGLVLVTAAPKAAGRAVVADHTLTGRVSALVEGRVTRVRLAEVDRAGRPPLEAAADDDGHFSLPVPQAGRWKLSAQVADRWRDVAWDAPDEVPAAPLHLTARGYVHLTA